MTKIGKYIFPIFFVLLVCSHELKGQKNIAGAGLHEFGVGIGALNYTGDVSPSFNAKFFRPGGMLFYRYNISPVISFRGAFMGGFLHADESRLQDAIPQIRQSGFSSPLAEFAVTVEYNFFNYRPKKEVFRYSPYLTTGLAAFVAKYAGSQLSIPLGLGLKYRLNKRINVGAEIVARKTFTDALDKVNSSYFVGVHQTATPGKDWYYYAGLSISWTAYSVICPKGYNQ